jgi:K+-sensing histidine kinase KdpD
MALLLVALTLFALDAFNVNPRDYAYLPLLPAVVVSALLLGFGPALVGVVAGTLISDYVYAPPPYSFAATEWKDAAGVAVFAILGAINAWMIQQIISFPE